MLSQHNWLVHVRNHLLDPYSHACETDVVLHAAPVSHASGCLVIPHLVRGAGQRMITKFDPEKIFDLIENEGVTTMFLAPTMINMMLEADKEGRRDMASLHTVIYGGAPMAVERIRETYNHWGPVLMQGYGQWEAPQQSTSLTRKDHVEAVQNPWPKSAISISDRTNKETDMSNAYVIGVGLTKFSRHPDRSVESLGAEAIIRAVKDAEVNWKDVQQMYGCHVNQGVAAGQRIIKEVGPTGIPVLNVENCSAAASTGIREASMAVRSGEMDLVVVAGFEKMAHGVLLNVIPEDSPDVATGATVLPMRFALMGQKHSDQFGTTAEQFADVSVKNRRHAVHNPNAQFQQEVTREDVLGSRMITDPITLFQCSPSTDGAAAVVICNDNYLKKRGAQRAVRLVANGLVSDIEEQAHNVYDLKMVSDNVMGVYERAGLGPGDLDVVETHDCFSVAEILAYEKLGLCPEGEGGGLLDEGATTIGGRIPVNPSGGLIGKGHPLGATGAGQVAEIVTQLRGEAGGRQVDGARIGLTSNMGMWSSCIHVLSA